MGRGGEHDQDVHVEADVDRRTRRGARLQREVAFVIRRYAAEKVDVCVQVALAQAPAAQLHAGFAAAADVAPKPVEILAGLVPLGRVLKQQRVPLQAPRAEILAHQIAAGDGWVALRAVLDLLAGQRFAQAAKIDPGNVRLLFERASAYLRAKQNLDEARTLLRQYLNAPLTPDDPPRSEAERLLKQAGT